MTTQLLDAIEELGNIPNEDELSRLIEFYPTYEWEHRFKLLRGYFENKTIKELVEAKLKAKQIDITLCTKQSLGGHARWVKDKVKRTIIRILFLRYVFDLGKTREQANNMLLQRFDSNKAQDAGQRTIRNATRSKIVDKKINY